MSKPGDRLQPLFETSVTEAAQISGQPAVSVPASIRRLLIANRGEIACRVIRSAQQMGIVTIAVYSEADRHARHVRMADEAICIGPAPALESYLVIEKIIAAATASQADAIHPGYGFLSENVDFAKACEQHGIRFIGPPPAAMAAMSSKSDAKSIMEKAGVPLLPGYHGADDNTDNLTQAAAKIGYPVILKPALGGGGKGMKIVRHESELSEAVRSAKREARSAFGDEALLLEKYLTEPRHIEVQVFADQHGHCVYLSDRDCSVQRRHQKIIEEAPAPGLSDDLRRKMGDTAVQAALAIAYVGAGTVEFLFDPASQTYYFMEMNTRLQVEHPVTELITGQDLVQWQIHVAEGRPLPLAQADIRHQGHAIEARLYAEDTTQGFLPASGLIEFLSEPVCQHPDSNATQPIRARIDSGIAQGDTVTAYYDPMLAKIIAWGENRTAAIGQLQSLLAQYQLGGVQTNLSYLQRILKQDAFKQANLSTHFIEQYQDALATDSVDAITLTSNADRSVSVPENDLLTAAALCFRQMDSTPLSGWRLNQPARQIVTLYDAKDTPCQFWFSVDHGVTHTIKLEQLGTGEENNSFSSVSLTLLACHEVSSTLDCHVEFLGRRKQIRLVFLADDDQILSFYQGTQILHRLNPAHRHHENQAEDIPVAPLNGVVAEVLCHPGQQVEKDQGLVVIEAMKMEYTVRAPHAGHVDAVLVSQGAQVQHGQELVQLSPSESVNGQTQ
ncbi:ATP-grasp domain-containing protein (plasmid) [Photobacterium sp. GJ3]|uniref:acetyl/propionyl/methylcrotonyl-CoA carboxylase subunit alpha n=1 Tax=Photobacterium sp. GJ3 TaxID=2829502 RepID=UPI001B8BB5B6|nr:biotin carboxylase N-terminal domain-containing protein [Photobacterium sp. GJ3]QUJ70511.1 ATP-grasp domain-containing protein [Photobacterium sp. GJ3]